MKSFLMQDWRTFYQDSVHMHKDDNIYCIDTWCVKVCKHHWSCLISWQAGWQVASVTGEQYQGYVNHWSSGFRKIEVLKDRTHGKELSSEHASPWPPVEVRNALSTNCLLALHSEALTSAQFYPWVSHKWMNSSLVNKDYKSRARSDKCFFTNWRWWQSPLKLRKYCLCLQEWVLLKCFSKLSLFDNL